ncbi:MAG TPA: EMC3/TMCO1 family protein [archaeon]|nr:EMC3/TMCO1 family protein [archaeon]
MLFLQNAALEIAVIAAGITIVLNVLQQVMMGSRHEIKKRQEKLNEKQKKLLELQKKNPEHPELKKLQEELAREMMPVMKSMMAYMAVTMVAVLPAFWFLSGVYEGTEVVVPVVGKMNWFWWYFSTALLSGLVVNKAQDFIAKTAKPSMAAS